MARYILLISCLAYSKNASDDGFLDTPVTITQILNEENLFDLMLITLGKTDSFGSSPYIEINNKRYYRTKNADEPDGAIYNQDFKYNISSGTGRSTGRSSHGDDETKQERIAIELDYNVDISAMDGTAISTIAVHINNAAMDIDSHKDESDWIKDAISLSLDFEDQSGNRTKRTFNLRISAKEGIYEDYFFDPTKYIDLERQ